PCRQTGRRLLGRRVLDACRTLGARRAVGVRVGGRLRENPLRRRVFSAGCAAPCVDRDAELGQILDVTETHCATLSVRTRLRRNSHITGPDDAYTTNSANTTSSGSIAITMITSGINRSLPNLARWPRPLSWKLRWRRRDITISPAVAVVAIPAPSATRPSIPYDVLRHTIAATPAAADGLGSPWKYRRSSAPVFVLNRARRKA